ncbi:hypothetical protein DMC64_41795 [Amycolatopsis sp. WAC 04197]|nr:hypothetical protein DMC64_41795 [Amycolatopsis sp. WAC 04197]
MERRDVAVALPEGEQARQERRPFVAWPVGFLDVVRGKSFEPVVALAVCLETDQRVVIGQRGI